MGRYRPPAPEKSPYITQAGFETLQEEEAGLWVKRRHVVAALSAAAEGDRSENAEYIYRKKELREIDYRIRYLQKRIPTLRVVTTQPSNLDQVFFSATITLENLDGEETIYRIVGPDEVDTQSHYISMDSPVAKALFKKHLDDEINVMTPSGKLSYFITGIQYE